MANSPFIPSEPDIPKAYKKLKSFKARQGLKPHQILYGTNGEYDLDNT
jgi:hypothetical protein